MGRNELGVTSRTLDGLFLDSNGMLTLVPTDTPLYICICKWPDGRNVYSKEEKECEDCLCFTKRVGMDLKGRIMAL